MRASPLIAFDVILKKQEGRSQRGCWTAVGYAVRVSMGLTVRRKTAKNLAVRRKNERILAVSRKKN